MGMRATIAYINKDNRVQLTTLQWSTILDRTLGKMIHKANENGDNAVDVVSRVFNTVTSDYEHASAIEAEAVGADKNMNAPLAYDTVVYGGHKRHEMDTATFPKDSVNIYTHHLNGGSIGAIYDESKPETIQFFWEDDETGDIRTRNCGIDALGKFYGNPKNAKKLKTFGSLRKH